MSRQRLLKVLKLFILVNFLLACSFVQAETFYIDFNQGDDKNTGRSKDSPWKTIPGTRVNSSDTLISNSYGGNVFVANATKVPGGTTFKVKSGTRYDSTKGGVIDIASNYYLDTATLNTPIRIERDLTWGSGPIVFDGSGIASQSYPVNLDGTAPILLIRVHGVQIDGTALRGFHFLNNRRSAIYVAERQGPNATFLPTSQLVFKNLYFFNNGTKYQSDEEGSGDGQLNIRSTSNSMISNIELDGDSNFINGVILGDNKKFIRSLIVQDSTAYNHRGDEITDDAGIGFKGFNGEVTFLNVSSHHNLKGFDLGEQDGGNVDITYKLINCTANDNYWGANMNSAGKEEYAGKVTFYIINSVFGRNKNFGSNIYASPFTLSIVHSLYFDNGNAAYAGEYSGNLRVSSNGPGYSDNGLITAHIYNNIFLRGYDTSLTTGFYDPISFPITFDADYNVYEKATTAAYFMQWAYHTAGQAINVTHGSNGPGWKSGNWYNNYGVNAQPPASGALGHFHADGNSRGTGAQNPDLPQFRNFTSGDYHLSASFKGLDLRGKSWFISEMGKDREGKTRETWDLGLLDVGSPLAPGSPKNFRAP